MKVLVLADTDIDGTGSAVVINWFHSPDKADNLFPEREELNSLFEDELGVRSWAEKYDIIYLCDTAPRSSLAISNIINYLAPKMVVFDHHITNYNLLAPYKDQFLSFKIEEGSRCSAALAYDGLMSRIIDPEEKEIFGSIERLVFLVNDIDLWKREDPRSSELADLITELGPYGGFQELWSIKFNPYHNTSDGQTVLENIRKRKARSLAMGRASLTTHSSLPFPFSTAIIDGFGSEVASLLVNPEGIIAVYDQNKNTVSLRVGSNFKYPGGWDCRKIAELFGGGGHPQAAGFNPANTNEILKDMSQAMGRVLSHRIRS